MALSTPSSNAAVTGLAMVTADASCSAANIEEERHQHIGILVLDRDKNISTSCTVCTARAVPAISAWGSIFAILTVAIFGGISSISTATTGLAIFTSTSCTTVAPLGN